MFKKEISLSVFLLSLISSNVFCQTNSYWKLGQSAGLNFKSGTAVVNPLDTCNDYMDDANTSICDNRGNLIFYASAYRVYDRLDRIMPNGSNFNHSTLGDPYINSGGAYPLPKGNVVIPFPNDTNKFYIFYESVDVNYDGNYLPTSLKYLVVDKSLNGGLGDVTFKDQYVIQNDTFFYGELLAIKHSNGSDYWLIARKYGSNTFYKVFISNNGIGSVVKQQIGNVYPYPSVLNGYANTSLDGTKISYPIASFSSSPSYPSQLDLFDFDRCTSKLKNYRTLQYPCCSDTFQFLASCFSTNGKFLYLNGFTKLYQMNLDSTNLLNGLKYIDTRLPSNDPYGQMEIGIDSIVYISPHSSSHYIHVINNPDSFGLACNEIQNQIYLGALSGSHWHIGNGALPNVPNFALGAINCNVGIEEIQTNTFDIFPNPANNLLFIKNTSFVTISIYNLIGELEQEQIVKQNATNEIEISKLSKGLHFIKGCNNEGLQQVVKFVKE